MAPPASPIDDPMWISSDVLTGVFETAAELGIDIVPDLRQAGIDPQMLAPPTGLIRFASLAGFMEGVAIRHDRPEFGFRLGANQQALHYGVVSQLPSLCSDVRSAFQCFNRYGRLYSHSYDWELAVEDGYAFLRRLETRALPMPMTQLVTFSVTITLKAIRSLIGSDWAPEAIYLTHDTPRDTRQMQRYSNAPIFFNADFTGIAFPAPQLDLPIATADPDLLASLTRYLDQLLASSPAETTMASKVLRQLRTHMSDQTCNLNWVAGRLGLHPRAVQRELAAEGRSFRRLANEAKVEMAKHLLESSRTPLTDISGMLGFANSSAFSRAFRNECGVAPAVWRQVRHSAPKPAAVVRQQRPG